MIKREPLGTFNAVHTRDPDELRERRSSLYAVRLIEPLKSRKSFSARLNLHQINRVGLGYASYTAPLRAVMANTDFYAQGFGVVGYGEAIVDGRPYRVSNKEGGVGGPGSSANLKYRADSRMCS